MGEYITGTGQHLENVHDPVVCAGEPCPIHTPSQHPMVAFPTHWRGDIEMEILGAWYFDPGRLIMERICPHGIGHPDPDDFKIRTGKDNGVHGCDGCCWDGAAS